MQFGSEKDLILTEFMIYEENGVLKFVKFIAKA